MANKSLFNKQTKVFCFNYFIKKKNLLSEASIPSLLNKSFPLANDNRENGLRVPAP